jgi:hypothetical protein
MCWYHHSFLISYSLVYFHIPSYISTDTPRDLQHVTGVKVTRPSISRSAGTRFSQPCIRFCLNSHGGPTDYMTFSFLIMYWCY